VTATDDPLAAEDAPRPPWADRYDARAFPPFSYTSDGVVFSGRDPADLRVATVGRDAPDPFAGLRAWPGGFVDWADDVDARAAVVRHLHEQAGLPEPPFLEPLDTYDAFGRDPRQFAEHGARGVSKAFWGLVRPDSPHDLRPGGRHASDPAWRSVYDILPWEDRRSASASGPHPLLEPVLARAAVGGIGEDRVLNAFGDPWNEERAGERIRLLLRTEMVEESLRDRWGRISPGGPGRPPEATGVPMAFDHRVMLADALGRLRGKIKYLPETLRTLMPDVFTLSELFELVSSIAGRPLDKPNFWRLFTRHKSVRLLEKVAPGRQAPRRGRAPTAYAFLPEVPRMRLDPSLRLPFVGPR
jgi:hypothetical protein